MTRQECCIPVVSAIIERSRKGDTEILMQTRWKPDRDIEYSGMIEVPAGWIQPFEDVYSALAREILEETGLVITRIISGVRTPVYSSNGDAAFAFRPFCCQQQLRGGLPWVGFVFLCEVEDQQPRAQADEVKDIRWVNLAKLGKMLENKEIFTLQAGVLQYYLSSRMVGGKSSAALAGC